VVLFVQYSLGMIRAFLNAVIRALPLGAVIILFLAPLHGATLERLTLTDMTAKSTVIVRAKVLDSYAAFSGPAIFTHYKLQITEKLKGNPVTEIAVRGGMANGIQQIVPGAPRFNKGDEYVFFLWTGRDGVTQVMGLTQGLFSVTADGSANPTVTRQASHELMLDRKTGHPVKDETLTMRMSELRSQIAASAAKRTAQ
jgi:hypothetical protein